MIATATAICGQDPPSTKPPAPAEKPTVVEPRPVDPNMVPDPEWDPRPGDRAVLLGEGGTPVLVATEMSALPEAVGRAGVGDGDGLAEMERYGLIARLPSGTGIRVVGVHDKHLVVIMKRDGRLMAEGVPTLEARLAEDGREGRTVWVSQPWAAMLIHRGRLQVEAPDRGGVPVPKRRLIPKRRDAAARAAGTLKVGELLEGAGKIEKASEAYRDVVRKYPGTPSAEAAGKRIEALETRP